MKNSIMKLLSPLAAAFLILQVGAVFGQTCPDVIQSRNTVVVTHSSASILMMEH